MAARHCARSDTVARRGGDEFCVVAPCSGPAEADALVARIEGAWEEMLELGATTLRVDRSIGVALFPAHGDEVEVLLRRADIAMYSAKAHNLVSVRYESGWDEHHQRQLALVADLREAIDGDQLTLEYQPQIDLATGSVGHVEALLRWDHPELGRISPAEFIPLAENAGYVRSLTRWVVGQVVRQCGAWQADGTDLQVAVNISALDLLDDSLPAHVAQVLEHHAVPPERITLEITESAVMQDAAHAMQVLRALRDTGVRLSIDDFGTGESSLAQLRRLPVDELKIDKSFILDLHESDADDSIEAIVRSTIELGHNMGLSVVAEGVETPYAREWLLRYGCDLAQGFLFSKPLAPAALEQWVTRFRAQGT
ncbi:MAG: bifunctional diguanylate cyclase/phosphodiesterase [Halofilum sp. (in: g-proteobacteria)]|nr:bifunctional diguanylate cyclase/phosphodiesterase [Halofilum sp. (in: g-proteobacteria)]